MPGRWSRFLLVSLLPLFLPTVSAGGQTVGATAGALDGRVMDYLSGVIPGVTVTLSGAALMRERTTVTNDEGHFRFHAVPPGNYTLNVTHEGFRMVDRGPIRVGVGVTTTVNVTLLLATLPIYLRVPSESAPIDKQSTALSTNFDARQLANFPGSRSMWSIQAATPSVYTTSFDVGGSAAATPTLVSAYGTAGANRPMVEGINVAAINPTGFTLNYGSFDEVSVLTGAHTAEWQAPGVSMQFVSKSGGNQYRGTLYADYENRAWQSFNVDADQIARGAQGGNGLEPRDVNRLWSYYDSNPDVGGYIKPDRLWWYFSFREQGVSARRVNFQVAPYRTQLTNYSGKATYHATPNSKLIAYAQAGRNRQPNLSSAFTLRPTAAISLSEDATANQLAWGWVWKVEWNSVINDRLFVEVRAGQFGANRQETPNDTAPRFEDISSQIVQGGNRDWEQRLRRNQVFGSLSHFKDGWLGNHHFKLGGEMLRTTDSEIWKSGYRDDVLHVRQNGTPIQVYLFETPSTSVSGLANYAAYTTDSWRVNRHLTLNLGVRFDRLRIFLPEQTHPTGRFNPAAYTFPAIDNLIDWNIIAPRLGAIHDLAGNGKTIAKVSYAQYWDAPGTQLGFNANDNVNQWWRRYSWSDPDNSGVWEPGEEGDLQRSRGGAGLETVDPGLKLPFVREAAAWIERELPASVAVRTGLVWRGARQNYERQNASQPFGVFTVPVVIPDPGPDGISGNADDGSGIPGYDLRPDSMYGSSVNIVRNVPNSDVHYWTWEITATKRFDRRWSLVAGFAHTWNRDHASRYLDQNVRQNMYPLTPNDLINAGEGGRYEFTIWSAKLHGTFEGPWGVLIAPFLRHQSGQPFGRTFSTGLSYDNIRVLAEPLGTRRMDNVTILDVRVEKGVRLAGNRRVAGFVDLFNALNTHPAQNISWSSGPSFLRPLNIIAPRIARVGATLDW